MDRPRDEPVPLQRPERSRQDLLRDLADLVVDLAVASAAAREQVQDLDRPLAGQQIRAPPGCPRSSRTRSAPGLGTRIAMRLSLAVGGGRLQDGAAMERSRRAISGRPDPEAEAIRPFGSLVDRRREVIDHWTQHLMTTARTLGRVAPRARPRCASRCGGSPARDRCSRSARSRSLVGLVALAGQRLHGSALVPRGRAGAGVLDHPEVEGRRRGS